MTIPRFLRAGARVSLFLAAALFAAGLLWRPAEGQSVELGDSFPEAAEANGEIRDLVVFKNGHAFVRRYYTLGRGDTLRIGTVPDAVFGTFFALADPEAGEVTSIQTEFVEARREIDCASLRDVILANVGKRLKFTCRDGGLCTGILAKVLTHGGGDESASPARSVGSEETITYSTWHPNWSWYPWWGPYASTRSTSVTRPATPPPALPVEVSYAIQTPEGMQILEAADVKSVLVLDAAPKMTFSMEGKARQLTVKVRRKREGSIVMAVVYLVKGVNWIPSYRITLPDEGEKAGLALHGILENDLESLRGARVRLAAGVPHFFRQEFLSPLTLEDVVASGGDAQSPRSLQRQVFYGARGDMFQNWASNASQVAGDFRAIGGGGPSGGEAPTAPLEGANEDLFLYDAGVPDLARGARAKILVRSAEVPFHDLYTWEITLDRAARDNYKRSTGSDLPGNDEESSRVWHALVLENRGDFPWTTGVATVFRKGQILAQERLTYTPAGAENELKLTVATDILNRMSDEEVNRSGNVRLDDGNTYYRMDERLSMHLSNLKREKVRVRVRRVVFGTVDATTDGKVKPLASGETPSWWGHGYSWYGWGWWGRYNPLTTVEWDLDLAAGEPRTLTVDRHYFFK